MEARYSLAALKNGIKLNNLPSEIKPPLLSDLSEDHDWYTAKIKATIKAMKNKDGSMSPTEACNDFDILTICRNMYFVTTV